MPRDLIVHIGTTKTGSTSIQRVMALHRTELLEQGICYPRSMGSDRHGMLAVVSATDRRRLDSADKPFWKGGSPEAKLESLCAEFDAEMKALPDHVRRIVVSAEQFSMTLLDRQSVQNLRDILAPYADRMTIVVWLRRPDKHYTSLYSEMFRWGETYPPGLVFARVTPANGYDFNGLLDRWASVFGEANVKPMLFEPTPGRKFDVVQDFLELCGATLKAPPDSKAANANQALSHASQVVLYRLSKRLGRRRRGTVESMQWRHLVDAVSEALPGKSWQPGREEAAEFNADYAENHEAVRRRWFPDRPSLFSQDFSDLPETAPELDDAAIIDASMTVALKLSEMLVRKDDLIAKQQLPDVEQAGNSGRQQRLLAKRLRVDPGNVEVRVKLVEALLKSGDAPAARRQLDKALKQAPRHTGALALEQVLRQAGE